MRDAEPNPFTIDETRLDEEWLAQPGLMRRAGEKLADARHELAKANARLAVVKADLRLAVRGNPGKHDLPDKPTKDMVDDVVETHADYKRANEFVLEAEHAVGVYSAECSALVDRRRTLQGLTDLAQLNYFNTEPRSRGGREMAADATKRDARRPLREREDDER